MQSGSFSQTLTGTITGGTGWCCGLTFDFQGSAIVPGLGSLHFQGTWLDGCAGVPQPTTTCMRQLDLQLISPSGDVLALSEDVTWTFPGEEEPSPAWTVDSASSTGRFAGYTGSGSYSVAMVGSGGVQISLSGTFVRGR